MRRSMKARSVFRPSLLAVLSLGLFLVLLDPLPLHASPTTIAGFTYDPCVPCVPPGDLVLFNANSSLALTGTIVAYTWDFGDGTLPVKSSSPLVSHDYYLASPNEWNVTLTVQNSSGLTDTIKQPVIFYVVPRFTVHPTRPLVGETTTFNASESIFHYPYS